MSRHDEDEDRRIYKVVVNHEERYSIWLADRPLRLGWNANRTNKAPIPRGRRLSPVLRMDGRGKPRALHHRRGLRTMATPVALNFVAPGHGCHGAPALAWPRAVALGRAERHLRHRRIAPPSYLAPAEANDAAAAGRRQQRPDDVAIARVADLQGQVALDVPGGLGPFPGTAIDRLEQLCSIESRTTRQCGHGCPFG